MNKPFYNRLLMLSALLGAIGVGFGAFGAHFLRSRLEARDLETLKTGVLYLFIHVLATLAICALSQSGRASRLLKGAGLAFIVGIFLFSGSLFLIATASLTGFPASAIGFVTPVGGLGFITGWILLALYGLRERL